MSNAYKGKYIRFTEVQIEIMDDFIAKTPGINNYAEAVRYAVLSLEDSSKSEENQNSLQRKLNVLSKNMDVLVTMVAGGFQSLDVQGIGLKEDSFTFQDAKKYVENDIKRATTVKSNFKKVSLKEEKITNEKSTSNFI